MKPLVAIVGRPNVGKSTLFNKIAGKRIAIVEDTPGVTRDRIYADAEWLNYRFTLIDTGGIEPESEDIIAKQMRRQAELAIETAQVRLQFPPNRVWVSAICLTKLFLTFRRLKRKVKTITRALRLWAGRTLVNPAL